MRINADWEVIADTHGWVVNHYRDGINHKTKQPTRIATTTYHPSLEKCCAHIIDADAKKVQKAEQVQMAIQTVMQQFVQAVNRETEEKVRKRLRSQK